MKETIKRPIITQPKLEVGETAYYPFKKLPKNLSCVYRLNYSNGFYYIGSTTNLKGRIGNHKFTHKDASCSGRIVLKDAHKYLLSVQVIYIIDDLLSLRKAEKEEIAKCGADEKLLNTIDRAGLPYYDKNVDNEKLIIRAFLNDFNLTEVAKYLGYHRRTMDDKIKKMKIKYSVNTICGLIMVFVRNKWVE